MSGQTSSDQAIVKLHHAAIIILHTIRGFEEAFDLFFILFKHCYEMVSQSSSPHQSLVLSAVNCARSAGTPLQLQVVKVLVKEVHDMAIAYHGFSIQVRTSMEVSRETSRTLINTHHAPSTGK